MNGPQIAWLPDGRRLHMNHGPIDLIVEAFGDEGERQAAYRQAAARFQTILGELVEELIELRRRASLTPRAFKGSTAKRMEAAVARHASVFITPMAAVAGAVADEMLAAMAVGRDLGKAYVNDGGDVALHIGPGQSIRAAIAGTSHGLSDRLEIHAKNPIRGIATSGWRGRSFSLGIADAVTVLAKTAADADAAATIIANAIDLPGHPAIQRTPANELAPDSDLGERPVTTGVGALSPTEINRALDAGLAVAQRLRRDRLIVSAALFLNGHARVVGFKEKQHSFAPPSALPDISPTGGDIGRPQKSRQSQKLPISPLAGEMSGRTEGSNVECRPLANSSIGPQHA